MRSRYPELPARYYVRVGEILARQGIDVAQLMKAANIRPELLARPDAMLRLDQVDALVAEVVRVTGRTDLPLDFGKALKLSSHDILGYGILSSPTVDYALRLAARFFRLITPTFRMRYRSDRQSAQIDFVPALPMSNPCFVFHLETLVVALHWEARELLQNTMPPYDAYLSIPEPPHVARYAELAEGRIHFAKQGSPGAHIVFPAGVANRALAMSDSTSLRMAEARCEQMIRHAVAQGQVSDWVRMMLREASDGMPTLTEVAHTLNLSPRTLDRHLRREGAHFRELSKIARHNKAHALLADGKLSVTQIAHELGYTDASNFTRAFRKENRVSPQMYRRRTP